MTERNKEIDSTNPESGPQRLVFWQYQLSRDLTDEDVEFIHASTGIKMYWHNRPDEHILGMDVVQRENPTVIVEVTRRFDGVKDSRLPGVAISLVSLEKQIGELGILDPSQWDAQRAAIEVVVAELESRENIE
jgi:hypothetical protein